MGVLFAIFLSLHMAMSYEVVKDEPIVRALGDGTETRK